MTKPSKMDQNEELVAVSECELSRFGDAKVEMRGENK